MKNLAIILLLVVSLALGVFAVHLQKQSAPIQAELVSLQSQLAAAQNDLKARAEADDQVASAKRSTKVLQDTLVKTSQFANEQAKQAELLQQKLAAAKTNSNNPLAGVAKMFKDPAMKEMIKSQQKTVMGPMIEKQYSALFQQLNLSGDQSAQLKQLLTDKMLSAADVGMSMMDDSLTAAQRADLSKQIKNQQDDYDTQIKNFLGDNYPAYQSYQQTIPDRTVVNQFSDQLTGDLAMTPDQQAQMIASMNSARTSFKWTTDFNNNNQTPPNGDYAALFSEANLNQFTQEKEQFDQQFLTQAQSILTAPQLTQFQQFQQTQRQMQLMGMKMAAQMFAPKSQ